MIIKFWGVFGSIARPLIFNDVQQKFKEAASYIFQTNINSFLKDYKLVNNNKKALKKLLKDFQERQGQNFFKFLEKFPFHIKGTYGGNTPCLTVETSSKKLLIFDAGTGIRDAGISLLSREFGKGEGSAHLFLSHSHFDHIVGWPFFIPIYIKGNQFKVYGAPKFDDLSEQKKLEDVFNGMMSYSYFPVTFRELDTMGAKLEFNEIGTGEFKIEDVTVKTLALNHPGLNLGYRIEENGKSFVYATDNEPYSGDDMDFVKQANLRVSNFAKGVDYFICDAQYVPEEYNPEAFGLKGISKKGWGHSTYEHAVERAIEAECKNLVLFHHEPQHTDSFLDEMLARAQKYAKEKGFKGKVLSSYEGLTIDFTK